ncbi:TetR/AcrR family transcriptional regulator [Nonomuraea sp. NPDC059023]|uniref:TetR/AcrR family transcriptional regulator n=1 Tax=unclassified Nonomuraea TaxID=2593643 RepID=UPI003686D341
MARPGDTKSRIQAVARELFLAKGLQKTSLQDIADRLGITKPALYYHFSSREELVRSIVEPLFQDGEAYVSRLEARGKIDVPDLLGEYFDFHQRHRDTVMLLLREMISLTDLGLVDWAFTSRERLAVLLVGENPTLEQAARATIALGGVADCAVQFEDAPVEVLRDVAVRAGCDALGLPREASDR